MTHTTEKIKTFALPDSHLHGAAIMACSIADHAQNVTDCERCAQSLSCGVAELQRLVFEVSDLLRQYDAALQLAVAAREHPSFKVPSWFFEPDSEKVKAMLTRRAKYLKAAKLDIDGCWDCLVEFLEANHYAVDEALLSEIVSATYAEKGGR